MPIIIDGKMRGFITFYLTNDENKYVEADPWAVLDDEPDGKIFYIAQFLTDKSRENSRISFDNWGKFKAHIFKTFLNVKFIRYRRWNKKRRI